MANPELSPEDDRNKFRAEILEKSVIALPLLEMMNNNPTQSIHIIIDLNLDYKEGLNAASEKVLSMLNQIKIDSVFSNSQIFINEDKNELSHQYVFAKVPADVLRLLIKMDQKTNPAIYKVWPDFEIKAQIIKSLRTVKADAAHFSFSALGESITWAIIDSGVDFSHPHFANNKHPHFHKDFTETLDPFQDDFGHGTHVAGIIGGEMVKRRGIKKPLVLTRNKDESGMPVFSSYAIEKISGIAPKCSLVSIKVLDADGKGQTSSLISAIAHIQKVNNYGRDLKIHGVNISLGYPFDPEWFACGQSPLCVEVNRLVKSGVVVVVAAGNTGYGFADTKFNGRMAAGMPLSINDPGNADLAITVGSTHREMPHTYGVSYFSSKGPTGDGRLKPDMIAPGERIISCAAGKKKAAFGSVPASTGDAYYLEESGTSMATPHVSGAIAAFLSIRREYIGQPEKVKEIFCSSATDLKRDPYFQGKGLVDLMRAIQSV